MDADRRHEQPAAQGLGDTIRAALQGAMVGAWGRENALRALAELEAENEKLREQVNSGRTGRERAEGLPEGTLPRV